MTVLVVDDAEANLAAVRAMLGDLDVRVVTVRSGADALRALLREDFALILLDVRMPGLDGFQTAELIRDRDRSRRTPIIFLTAFDRSREEELRGYHLGAVDFLSKPIVPQVLHGKVAVLIELQRKTEEIRVQAAVIEEAQRKAHERELEAERRRWEQRALEVQVERERRHTDTLRHANARLRLVSETASDLLLAQDAEPTAAVAARLFARVATHVRLELGAWHERGDRGELLLAAHEGLAEPELAALRSVEPGGGTLAHVAATGESRAFQSDRAGGAVVGAAGLALPVVTGRGVQGVITFATRAARVLEPDEVAALELISRAVSAALERWRLVAELRGRAAALKEADARKDQFLAMLGHELRNPLAPVLNAVKLMQRRDHDPIFRPVVAAADRQIRHMTRLLDDLLDVSRIRNGKIELRRTTVDVRDVVRDAVHATEAVFADLGHALVVDVPEARLLVDGDPVRLSQIIGNLLHNAGKYTDRGGHVTVAARRVDAEIVITVTDDGIGIPPAMLPRVFDMFVQVEQGADRASGGLGLGLTLVRSLVEMHGGAVAVRSDGEGAGSEFEVRLPALADAGAELIAAAEARDPARVRDEGGPASRPVMPGAARGALQIVLVEDNADIRESLKALLKLQGHEVFEAEDGRRGVELVRMRRPNVALVDIGLPGIDGYEVAREVRASNSATRLIAMTGYGRPDDRRLALDAGFHAHLVKPVDFDDLTRLLDDPS